MLLEEGRQLVERNDVQAVVQIGVVGTWDDHQLLGFGRRRVGSFTEVARVRFLAMDEQDRAG